MHPVRIGLLLLLTMGLLACGGQSGTSQEDGAGAEQFPGGDGADTTGMSGDGLGEGSRFEDDAAMAGDALAGPSASVQNRLVYFEFDRSEVLPEYRELLDRHGQYLVDNPGARVRLEGHTDERGSREYNIGLGERRAQSVRQLLLLQGVSADQLSTVSYGEERPAVLGSDDEAWALNRRVELVYGR
jgi:peptidoglycan-associated lipoprotein